MDHILVLEIQVMSPKNPGIENDFHLIVLLSCITSLPLNPHSQRILYKNFAMDVHS